MWAESHDDDFLIILDTLLGLRSCYDMSGLSEMCLSL